MMSKPSLIAYVLRVCKPNIGFINNHVIQNFSKLMSRVKTNEASVVDMSNKEGVQDRFKRWNNRSPFLKRKRKVNVVEPSNKK